MRCAGSLLLGPPEGGGPAAVRAVGKAMWEADLPVGVGGRAPLPEQPARFGHTVALAQPTAILVHNRFAALSDDALSDDTLAKVVPGAVLRLINRAISASAFVDCLCLNWYFVQ